MICARYANLQSGHLFCHIMAIFVLILFLILSRKFLILQSRFFCLGGVIGAI